VNTLTLQGKKETAGNYFLQLGQPACAIGETREALFGKKMLSKCGWHRVFL